MQRSTHFPRKDEEEETLKDPDNVDTKEACRRRGEISRHFPTPPPFAPKKGYQGAINLKLSPPWIWERGEVVVPYNLVKKGVKGWCRLWRRHPCLGNEVATREKDGEKRGGELVKEICVCDRLLLLLLLLSGPGTEGPRHTHDGWRLVSRENGGNRRHRGDIKSFPSILPLGKHFGNSDELLPK